jgi:cytochrome P450
VHSDLLTLDASDPRFYDEANRPAYLEIHAADPVYLVDAAYAEPFWNVCRHDLIREVGKQPVLFTTEYGVHLENTTFATAGAEAMANALKPPNILPASEHQRQRAPLNPHFRHDAIGRMEDDVRQMVRDLLDEVEPGAVSDFMSAFAARVPLRVTARLFGVSVDREPDYMRWGDAIVRSFEPGSEPDWEAVGEFIAFFGHEIAARRERPAAGLVSEMLTMGFSDQEILMWCCLLFAAGIETTGNLIAGGMDLLLRHPDQTARLVADRSQVRHAVSEMVRVVTPGRYIRRTATEDTVLAGHPITSGQAVVMNFTVANYDPRLFVDPLRFDIDRRPNDALSFSYGPHRCIGMSVARLESIVAFEELLARFPNAVAAGPAVYRPTLATVVVDSLPVVLRP